MRTFRFMSASLLLVCVFLGVTSYVRKRDITYPARSYKIIFNETDFSPDGLANFEAVRVRWVTETGQWKELRTAMNQDGTVTSKLIFSKPEGQFVVDVNARTMWPTGKPRLSPTGQHQLSPTEFRSTAFLRRRPGFIGEESVAQLPAFAFRNESDPKEPLETYYSPQTGSVPIKIVYHYENGGRHVIEAVQVLFVEVSEDMLALPDLPIKLDGLEKRIASHEKAEHYEEAEALRQMMKEWQERLRTKGRINR